MVNDLENFIATTEHRRPGRILYYAEFVDDIKKRVQEHIKTNDIENYFGMVRFTHLNISFLNENKPVDYSVYWKNEKLPEGTKIDENGVAMVPSGFYHFWGYVSPLRNAKDISELENYPLQDFSDIDVANLQQQVSQTHKEGKVARAYVGDIYEPAWQIRGNEEFLMDMIERPSWSQCLLDRLFEQNMLKAKAFAQAGTDWMMCGDDVASQKSIMFAPETWRQSMLSRWSNIWTTIKEINSKAKIWYHSDGNIMEIVEDLIDAGVDILNPLQPECMDIDEVYRRYGKRVTFDGCVGTQSTMPFGSPSDVRNRVKELIKKLGKNGGLILSPTHALEPEVPIANIEAFFQACKDFGTFS